MTTARSVPTLWIPAYAGMTVRGIVCAVMRYAIRYGLCGGDATQYADDDFRYGFAKGE